MQRDLQKNPVVWGAALIVAVLTFVVFTGTLGSGFLGWDDNLYVYENQMIRSLGGEFFSRVFTEVVAGNWHPLTMISHAVDYSIFGLDPRGHHLTSILIHALNTFVVMLLAVRLSERTGVRSPLIIGIAVAAFFGLHPLRVESVAWISERKDLLCALFFLLSIYTWLDFKAAREKTRSLILSLAFFALALLSKPMAISLPVVLLILDFYPLKRLWAGPGSLTISKLIREKIPFIALSVASAGMTLWAQNVAGAVAGSDYPIGIRILVAARGYIFYLYKTILPVNLAPLYPYPHEVRLLSLEFAGAILLLIAITATVIVTAKKQKLPAALWAFFVITLVPVIGIVQVGSQGAADRYTYLPGLAPFFIIAIIIERLVAGGGTKRKVTIAVSIALVIIMAFLTSAQCRVWRDSISLWSRQIELYPTGAPGPYNDRGQAYSKAGEFELALIDMNAAIKLQPDYAMAYNNRAVVLMRLGRNEEALADIDLTIKLDPAYSKAYVNRGLMLSAAGDQPGAVRALTKALELDPASVLALNNRGIAYTRSNKYELALADYRSAIKLNPEYSGAYRNMAVTYGLMGDEDAKLRLLKIAASLGDSYAIKVLEGK